MDLDGFDSCKICMELYDSSRRPRTIKCGHTFCSKCLSNVIKVGPFTCPFCMQIDNGPFEFPINFSMEEMIAGIRKVQAGNRGPPQVNAMHRPYQPRGADSDNTASLIDFCLPPASSQRNQSISLPPETSGLSTKMHSIIQGHKTESKNLIRRTEEVLFDLDIYTNFLTERITMHGNFYDEILALANENKEMVDQLKQEFQRVNEARMKGEMMQRTLDGNLVNLQGVTAAGQALATIEELDKCYSELEQWNKNTRKAVPDGEVVISSEKMTRDHSDIVSVVLLGKNDHKASGGKKSNWTLQSPLTIGDKLNRLVGNPTLKILDLRDMPSNVTSILKRGHLYAFQMVKGKMRYAKLTRDSNNKIYLHCLQDGEPPEHAHTIEHGTLIRSLNPKSVEVYMDLSFGGKPQGRIHIHLSPSTPLAENFRSLCTGELGPSYVNSKFLEVSKKGHKYDECIRGGDYEWNTGTGGAPVVKGLNIKDAVYSRKIETGMIWATHKDTDGSMSSQFSIRTGRPTAYQCVGAFGNVVGGIDVVQAAAKVPDIKSVGISNCGVVIPS